MIKFLIVNKEIDGGQRSKSHLFANKLYPGLLMLDPHPHRIRDSKGKEIFLRKIIVTRLLRETCPKSKTENPVDIEVDQYPCKKQVSAEYPVEGGGGIWRRDASRVAGSRLLQTERPSTTTLSVEAALATGRRKWSSDFSGKRDDARDHTHRKRDRDISSVRLIGEKFSCG